MPILKGLVSLCNSLVSCRGFLQKRIYPVPQQTFTPNFHYFKSSPYPDSTPLPLPLLHIYRLCFRMQCAVIQDHPSS